MVGIVATIMAVVSSDALRLGGGIPAPGRNDRAAPDASQEAPAQPVVAAASELNGNGAPQAPVASVTTEVAAVDPAPAPAGAPPDPAVSTLSNLRQEGAPEILPQTMASLQPAAAPSAATPLPADAPPAGIADLRTEGVPATPGSPGPETTASVSAAVSGATAPAAGDPSIWPRASAVCPRDWVVGDAAPDVAGCSPTAELIASVAEGDQSALEQAAAVRAESLGIFAPRIPLPRPDVAPPAAKPVHVSRASSNWPAAPPPNCGAGKHAKWRFVDRKAGTKEWDLQVSRRRTLARFFHSRPRAAFGG